MDIPLGITHEESTVVDHTNVASALRSGMVDVFATPMMVALLEKAAATCVQQYIGEGNVTVGTHVDVEHSGATPIGMKVTAAATVTAVDRRRVDFDVVVHDEAGEVGRGTHTRFIVNLEKFTAKAGEKKKA